MSSNVRDSARSGRMDAARARYCVRRTRFGPVAVLWSAQEGRPRIGRILLPTPESSAERAAGMCISDARRSSCAEVDLLAGRIAAFLAGEDVRFSPDDVLFDACSPFQQEVLRACHRIPRGRVSTYGRIAEQCGHRDAARAAGTALAANPFPIVIPCHRVIRSDGSLGGFGGGLRMKRALLAMEGVAFDASDRVRIAELF